MSGPARPSPSLPTASRAAAAAALLSLLALPWLHPIHGAASAGGPAALRAGIAQEHVATAPASACALCHGRAQARQAAPGGRVLVAAAAAPASRLDRGMPPPRPDGRAPSTAFPRAPPAPGLASIRLGA